MISRILGLALLGLGWAGWFSVARGLAANKRIAEDWRLSWLLACSGWGATVVALTEVSSLFQGFDRPVLFAGWIGASLVTWTIAFRLRRTPEPNSNGHDFIEASADGSGRPDWMQRFFVGISAVILLLLAIIAVATPAPTGDGLTYHLPRIMHWIQNHSVHFFPTSNSRQNEFGPWSGFVLAHLRLLSGTDRFFNLVQWFGLLGTALAASLLAEQLLSVIEPLAPIPLRRRVGAFAFFLVVALPIGIVEATTVQNDLSAAFWVMNFLCCASFLVRHPANSIYPLGAGVALGLGTLTKAAVFLYAAPWVMALGAWLLFGLHPRTLQSRQIGILIAAFLALNSPHMLRNYLVEGSPLGSAQILQWERNKTVSVSGTWSNLIRNLSLEGNTGIPFLTRLCNQAVAVLHRWSGRDLQDAGTTYHLGAFFFPDRLMVADSYASSFWHALLIAAGLGGALRLPSQSRRLLLGYAALAGISAILFCALLRWQIWHSRLHLAYLAILVPWTAAILGRLRYQCFVWMGILPVATMAFYCVFHNNSRPILSFSYWDLPREEKYMAIECPWAATPLIQFSRDVMRAGGKDVGLKFRFNDPEFALWLTLQKCGFSGRIDHLEPEGSSGKFPRAPGRPFVLLTWATNEAARAWHEQFPYRLDYERWDSYWSEDASGWCEFVEQNFLGPSVAIEAGTARPMPEGQIRLVCRSVRSGTLRFSGKITERGATPISSVVLHRSAGSDQTVAGGTFRFEVPDTRPQEFFTLSVSPGGNAELRIEAWSWEVKK